MKSLNLEKQFQSVKATLEMEGLVVKKEMEELILSEAKGEITFEEMLEVAEKKGW